MAPVNFELSVPPGVMVRYNIQDCETQFTPSYLPIHNFNLRGGLEGDTDQVGGNRALAVTSW